MEVLFGTSIYLLYLCCNQKPIEMREQDQKVQAIARETGMLYMHEGREYASPISVGDFRMEFEYSNPEDVAYIEVYAINSVSSKPISIYYEDFEDVQIDYPQFFDN